MANTLKPKQKAIVEFIEANGLATPRQIRTLLSCDIREAYDRLKRLRMAGILKNIGKPHHPEYRLVKSWRTKAKTPEPRVEVRSIADVCRDNWQGYQVHKIFGSARV
ncbi:Hypothetical protein AKI40_2780 [Enterobacter sp. FY-07]|uniref:hypothetical protein n=1 Tax=Kosakonia oryzendophytica TaxID=1005665 RepID=UPI0007779D9D|nr:hypothetical protein [Kosakonia oryzendophytica]AMO49169.1 Hypothetical protein AKI40_2780 [Enterobacter sp. FY-07]WBT56361.1 hypothetical protein O9K67_14275 [Kosakonia oryzendophytica]